MNKKPSHRSIANNYFLSVKMEIFKLLNSSNGLAHMFLLYSPRSQDLFKPYLHLEIILMFQSSAFMYFLKLQWPLLEYEANMQIPNFS